MEGRHTNKACVYNDYPYSNAYIALMSHTYTGRQR